MHVEIFGEIADMKLNSSMRKPGITGIQEENYNAGVLCPA